MQCNAMQCCIFTVGGERWGEDLGRVWAVDMMVRTMFHIWARMVPLLEPTEA